MNPHTPRTLAENKEPALARAAVIFGVVLVSSLVVGLLIAGHDDSEVASKASGTESAKSAQSARSASAPVASSQTQSSAWTAEPSAIVSTSASSTASDEPAVLVEATDNSVIIRADLEPAAPVTYQDAEAAYLGGDYAAAADLFARYTTDKPNNPWGHYMSGLASRRIGNLEDAESAFLACLAIDPDHGKSLVNLGRTRIDAERAADAEEVVRRAVVLDPESVDAHRVLARALHTQGKRTEALDEYAAALSINPADAWSLNNRGLILIEEERFAEAASDLTAACAADDTQAAFRNNLGIALERTGRFADAEQSFAAALDLDADYDKAAVSLTRVEGRENVEGSAAAAPTFAEARTQEVDSSVAFVNEEAGSVEFATASTTPETPDSAPEAVRITPEGHPTEDRP